MRYDPQQILPNFNSVNPNVILAKKIYYSIWDETRTFLKSLLLKGAISLTIIPINIILSWHKFSSSATLLVFAMITAISLFYMYAYNSTTRLIQHNEHFIRFTEFTKKDPSYVALSETDLITALLNVTKVHSQCISAYNILIDLSNALIATQIFLVISTILMWW